MLNENLRYVEQLLADGNIQQAEQFNRKMFKNFPDSFENKYCEALILLFTGENEQALKAFSEVEEHFCSSPKFYNNFGKAALDFGEAEKAGGLFRKALEIEPGNNLSQYNLACTYIQLEKNKQAKTVLESLVAQSPDNADYLCALADVYRLEGGYKKSIRLYQSVLKIQENHIAANSNIGVLLVYFGQVDGSLKHCLKATKFAPKNALSHLNLGRCLVRLERFEEAMNAFADAFVLEPESPEICAEIADVWFSSGDLQEASDWYKRALKFSPDSTHAIAGIARILLDADNIEAALVLLDEKLEIFPDDIDLNRAYVDALWDDGDVNKAIKTLDKIQSSIPENPWLLSKKGQLLASSGDVDGSLDCYRKALMINPICIPALHGLAVKQRSKFDTKLAKRMQKLLLNDALKDGSKALLHNGLSYYYDGHKKWMEAADHMSSGNKFQWSHQHKRGWDYDQKECREYFEKIRSIFTKEYFQSIEGFGSESEQPVFIVGMPRSGTTLTEQILARHKQVLGIGERNFAARFFSSFTNLDSEKIQQLPDSLSVLISSSREKIQAISNRYLQQLENLKNRDGDENIIRIVDKMPDNYSLIGWILTLFPKAKIIHCRRDPRDIILSCWITQFGKIQWASRINDLCHRINQYHLMMEYWRSIVPDHLLEINYEDMVENQEAVSKKLINWIGLEWDTSCLKFYESDRIVRTASITQVRSPIYKSSVGRWKPYTPFIPELLTIKNSSIDDSS